MFIPTKLVNDHFGRVHTVLEAVIRLLSCRAAEFLNVYFYYLSPIYEMFEGLLGQMGGTAQ